MLELEIIKFEIQDVITASCACEPGAGTQCEQADHPNCFYEGNEGHKCGLGES